MKYYKYFNYTSADTKCRINLNSDLILCITFVTKHFYIKQIQTVETVSVKNHSLLTIWTGVVCDFWCRIKPKCC